MFSVSLNLAGAEWSWALGRLRQVKRPRSWRTGVTLRQVSLQPTQSSQHNRSERRKSGRGRHVPAPKGEGRRATDRSQREGPQTRRLEGKGFDLRGHHLCGPRNSQGTVAGERVSSPAEAMMQAYTVHTKMLQNVLDQSAGPAAMTTSTLSIVASGDQRSPTI